VLRQELQLDSLLLAEDAPNSSPLQLDSFSRARPCRFHFTLSVLAARDEAAGRPRDSVRPRPVDARRRRTQLPCARARAPLDGISRGLELPCAGPSGG
jgi:hypothetical protein